MVLTSVKVKLKRMKKGKSLRIKFDMEKLRDPDIAAQFQATEKLRDPNIADQFQATIGGKLAHFSQSTWT